MMEANFQARVDRWMDACFGEIIKADRVERCDRFIEESLEFVQAVGCSSERAHALVEYVFGRPIGEVKQEVGGVMVTLAAACNTVGVDIEDAAHSELTRVWTKVDAIRAKQAAKPTGSALPIASPTIPHQVLDDLSRQLLVILANIQAAAQMAEAMAADEDEAMAWKMIRDKASEGSGAYRAVRFPPPQTGEAD